MENPKCQGRDCNNVATKILLVKNDAGVPRNLRSCDLCWQKVVGVGQATAAAGEDPCEHYVVVQQLGIANQN